MQKTGGGRGLKPKQLRPRTANCAGAACLVHSICQGDSEKTGQKMMAGVKQKAGLGMDDLQTSARSPF